MGLRCCGSPAEARARNAKTDPTPQHRVLLITACFLSRSKDPGEDPVSMKRVFPKPTRVLKIPSQSHLRIGVSGLAVLTGAPQFDRGD